jgi:hypothetical protein
MQADDPEAYGEAMQEIAPMPANTGFCDRMPDNICRDVRDCVLHGCRGARA